MRRPRAKPLFGVPAIALCAIVGCLNAGWWQTFGGADSDIGYCVQQTTDGGYIVAGETYSFGRPGEPDMWLIKLDSLGHVEWDRTYEPGYARSVRQTSDGGYIIAGDAIIRTDENGEPIWTRDFGGTGHCVQIANDGNYIISGSHALSLWLIKINDNGDSLWAKTYQIGNYGDRGRFIEQTLDGGYIIAGSTADEDPEIEDIKSGVWLLKTNELGDTTWTKTYGGEDWGDTDRGNCVLQTDDEDYIITGAVNDIVLIKTDANGDTIWTEEYGDGIGHCVEQTLDGGFILTGSIRTASTSSTLSNWDNLWLVKTDEIGDSTWTVNYGNGSDDAGRYVQQTTDSGYIVVGHTVSFGAGSYDVYLLKTDSLGLLAISEPSIKEKQVDWELVQSIGNNIQIRYSNRSQGFRANIYNTLGQKVDELHVVGSSGNVAWGSGYPSGVYFVRVAYRNKVNNTARVVLIH